MITTISISTNFLLLKGYHIVSLYQNRHTDNVYPYAPNTCITYEKTASEIPADAHIPGPVFTEPAATAPFCICIELCCRTNLRRHSHSVFKPRIAIIPVQEQIAFIT